MTEVGLYNVSQTQVDWYSVSQAQQKLWNPQTLTVQQIIKFVESGDLSIFQMKNCIEKVITEYHYSWDDLNKFNEAIKYFIDQITLNVYPAFEKRSMISKKLMAKNVVKCIKQSYWLYNAACRRINTTDIL